MLSQSLPALHWNIVSPMLSEYAWDNIVQENHLGNVGPKYTVIFSRENNL